ncbi:MAG TPA: M23 family metallopeptidase [Candidatus Acidoferrales bacterium]
MKTKSYTFIVASSGHGSVRKVSIPFYLVHILAIFAVVGGITVAAAVGSYSRMLWKTANYDAVRGERDTLKERYQNMQEMVSETNQRLSSLQSLATEVAMTYGITRFRLTPFGISETALEPAGAYQQSVDQFEFLVKHAPAVAMVGQGIRLMPGRGLEDLAQTPSMWPVMGRLAGAFGERMDPFSGEGAFHAGVDITSFYGDTVRATADGVVVAVENRAGFGRLVVVDHGFGLATWYGHLSGFNTRAGTQLKRGDVIGYVGVSGRATGPHVHYEVRIHGNPVNPWRYLRNSRTFSGD